MNSHELAGIGGGVALSIAIDMVVAGGVGADKVAEDAIAGGAGIADEHAGPSIEANRVALAECAAADRDVRRSANDDHTIPSRMHPGGCKPCECRHAAKQ